MTQEKISWVEFSRWHYEKSYFRSSESISELTLKFWIFIKDLTWQTFEREKNRIGKSKEDIINFILNFNMNCLKKDLQQKQ